jgi:hypothetical protein
MWVYRSILGSDNLQHYTVGFFAPNANLGAGAEHLIWYEDESFISQDEARARCSYLNGGLSGGARSSAKSKIKTKLADRKAKKKGSR